MKATRLLILALFAVSLMVFSPQAGFSQAPFYQGKTITIVQARTPSGSRDLGIRAIVPILRKHIPGNPTIVLQYMPGGGGRTAANYIYNTARPDGLTIGSMQSALLAHAILGLPGVQYDVDKLIYLGSVATSVHYVFVTRKGAALHDLKTLRAKPSVRIGAFPVGHPLYIAGRFFVFLLGLNQPNIVPGYEGGEIDVALMRGEVEAATYTPETMLARNPDLIDKESIDLHAVIEIPKGRKHPNPRFAKLPELEEFVKSERHRELLTMHRSFRTMGQPFVLPPGTPKVQVEIFKDAMRRTFKDPDLVREYHRLVGEDPAALSAEELAKVVKGLPRDSELVDLYNKLAGGEPLPVR